MSPAFSARALSVRDLIAARARSRSRPKHRDDPHTLALCIEGGAMRGVVSAGMVVALEQLGLLNVFDRVYGSSAGALNAAFFVAGQAGLGTTIYYEDINNSRFIDFRRTFGKRPIVDLDFLVWDVMHRSKPLDAARVRNSAIEFRILATAVASGERAAFSHWTDDDDFFSCLRAGASMPVTTGPPYAYQGAVYWDALVSEPIPARIAEEEGCSHVMVLLTRPRGHTGPRLSVFERLYIAPKLRAVSRPLAQRYLARAADYAQMLAALDAGVGPRGRASALAVAPAGPVIDKLERRRSHLVAGAHAGRRAVLDVFESIPRPFA
jgi:predicted patatin/cPLA2 family phospholipase